jgi:prevent-host-death family protein
MSDPMKLIGIKQARQELADLVDRADAGEEIIITAEKSAI